MKYREYSFEKLEVYKLARSFRVEIKRLTKAFPVDERFELTSQIRRSSSSIATNIAEGSGRASSQDQAHFTNIAYSSAYETIDHLSYALDMEYIDEVIYSEKRLKLDEIIYMLNGLYQHQISKVDNLKTFINNKKK